VPVQAIFLDRDGVINRNRDDYVRSWDQFEFLPGALAALRDLAALSRPIVVVTNQSAIGRGLVDEGTVQEIHRRMRDMVTEAGGRIDLVLYCPHRPDQGCECRKPRPELLHRAAREMDLDLEHSVFVGDSEGDVLAAVAAGCEPILLMTGLGRRHLPRIRERHASQLTTADDLAEAAKIIRMRSPRGTAHAQPAPAAATQGIEDTHV
jgi:D-glycero-D-manno-heptose 1,7-bisphosphate phosphatase